MKRLSLWSVAMLLLLAATQADAQTLTKEEQKVRLQKAETLFKEHCKASGEFIKRTVDNVEGIYLLKLRPKQRNRSNQFVLDDPYGDDLPGTGYIESFVRGSVGESYIKHRRSGSHPRFGYYYVEAIDPQDGKRYRYTGRVEEPWQHDKSYLKGYKRFVMDKAAAPGVAPRYGVTYDDISTHEDREYWIAGSSLKVIDLKTNEVIAERIGYMIDLGQGANDGGRSPWMMAADHACPDFHRFPNPVVKSPGFTGQARQAQDFVENVLHPIVEDK